MAQESILTSKYVKLLLLAVAIVGLLLGLSACTTLFGVTPTPSITYALDDPNDTDPPVDVTFTIKAINSAGLSYTYELDFGDWTTDDTGTDLDNTGKTVSHTYNDNGPLTATLTITFTNMLVTATVTDTVNVKAADVTEMITFAAKRDTTYGIFRMEADGTNEETIIDTSHDELFPDVIPNVRNKVAYSVEDGTVWDIYKLTIGGSATALTTQTDSNQVQPSWSHDGDQIAYASKQSGDWQIYTMTSAGESETAMSSIQTDSWAPAFSPANDDIVFVSTNGATGGSSIWLWDDSASNANELYDSSNSVGGISPNDYPTGLGVTLDLPDGDGVSKPAWSPDGTMIAFSRERSGLGIIDIYVIEADGDNPESLEAYVEGLTGDTFTNTITSGDDEFCPYWLENESGLAFTKKESDEDFNIYFVDFSDGSVTALTSDGDDVLSPAKKQ